MVHVMDYHRTLKDLNEMAKEAPDGSPEKASLAEAAGLLAYYRELVESGVGVESDLRQSMALVLGDVVFGTGDPDTWPALQLLVNKLVRMVTNQTTKAGEESRELYDVIDLLTAKNLEIIIAKQPEDPGESVLSVTLSDVFYGVETTEEVPDSQCDAKVLTNMMEQLDTRMDLRYPADRDVWQSDGDDEEDTFGDPDSFDNYEGYDDYEE